MRKGVLVLDTLIFESLCNDTLVKYLTNDKYFILLWTDCDVHDRDIINIPYHGHINGLRNGCKPYRYLRMFMRRYFPNILGLPVIILDFERNFNNSRFGYDKCIDINDVVTRQEFNNRDIYVIDVVKLFEEIDLFIKDYSTKLNSVVSEETVVSENKVLSMNDMLGNCRRGASHKNVKQQITNKRCVLVVGSNFFSIYHNVPHPELCTFLNSCHLVVWMNNKNVNEIDIQKFRSDMRTKNNINVNFMLFGLDRNVKSISYVRRFLLPTKLPFIIIDNLKNIYDTDDVLYTSLCDFDYYINLQEYIINRAFFDFKKIIFNITKFINITSIITRTDMKRKKVQIVEYHSDDSSSPKLGEHNKNKRRKKNKNLN